jgi:hypothetical protein
MNLVDGLGYRVWLKRVVWWRRALLVVPRRDARLPVRAGHETVIGYVPSYDRRLACTYGVGARSSSPSVGGGGGCA